MDGLACLGSRLLLLLYRILWVTLCCLGLPLLLLWHRWRDIDWSYLTNDSQTSSGILLVLDIFISYLDTHSRSCYSATHYVAVVHSLLPFICDHCLFTLTIMNTQRTLLLLLDSVSLDSSHLLYLSCLSYLSYHFLLRRYGPPLNCSIIAANVWTASTSVHHDASTSDCTECAVLSTKQEEREDQRTDSKQHH